LILYLVETCHYPKIGTFQVTLRRRELNSNLKEFVRQYYHINNSLEVEARKSRLEKRKAKGLQYEKIILTEKNTFFIDVEVVQRTIVKLYGIKSKVCIGSSVDRSSSI
jgi:hypothetical protein